MKDCFVYISQIPQSGNFGQNKFEKSFITSLLKKGDKKKELEIKIFSPSTNGDQSKDERLQLIPLGSKSYKGYIQYQFHLFYSLVKFLWRRREGITGMFVRCHPAMLSPLILSWFFNIPLAMRSGPVLPSLFFYDKNPGAIVFNSIKLVLGLFYKKASSIVTVTEKTKQWILETYKINPEKIVVIPNAADTTLFYLESPSRKKWNLPENEYIFGFTGTIYEEQGLSTILQAFGFLKKNKEKVPFLFIVGDGKFLSHLKSLSEELDITDHIIWTGNIPHEQVRSAINACDMMLAPYQKKVLEYQGSSALKLWEYLACDKPILASAHNDHQFLEKWNLGRMIEPENIELWAKALVTEAKRKNFLLQGRGEKYIIEKHSYDLVVEKFISLSFGSERG